VNFGEYFWNFWNDMNQPIALWYDLDCNVADTYKIMSELAQ